MRVFLSVGFLLTNNFSRIKFSQPYLSRSSKFRYFASMTSNLPTSDAGWRTILSPMQFKVLREKATEPPGYSEKTAGELEYQLKKEHGTKYPSDGVYTCAACNVPLYTATSKFDSGCGWPAFYEGVPGAIKEIADADGRRVEIVCKNCGSHLGHVFRNEGFSTPTNERHCVNGICLKYDPATAK